MSEMAWQRDEFNEDMFGESIDDAALRALDRLRSLRTGNLCEYEPGDMQYEQYMGEEFGFVRTRIFTFAAVFDSLHAAIMRSDIMSDYLHTIVARLVSNGVKEQSSSAGNLTTQLPPDKDALNTYARQVWDSNTVERQMGIPFSFYRFYIGRDITSVVFSPDSEVQTWSLGYEMPLDRVLVTTNQSIGCAWRTPKVGIED